jgi:hypothetical protein
MKKQLNIKLFIYSNINLIVDMKNKKYWIICDELTQLGCFGLCELAIGNLV